LPFTQHTNLSVHQDEKRRVSPKTGAIVFKPTCPMLLIDLSIYTLAAATLPSPNPGPGEHFPPVRNYPSFLRHIPPLLVAILSRCVLVTNPFSSNVRRTRQCWEVSEESGAPAAVSCPENRVFHEPSRLESLAQSYGSILTSQSGSSSLKTGPEPGLSQRAMLQDAKFVRFSARL
jgi:hypothetical protein